MYVHGQIHNFGKTKQKTKQNKTKQRQQQQQKQQQQNLLRLLPQMTPC